MSLHHSWVAVQGTTKEALFEELRLEETGEMDVPTGWRKPEYGYAELPGGWIVLVHNMWQLGDPKLVQRLSRLGSTIACQFQDQVEAPQAEVVAAEEGTILWEVATEDNDVVVTGTPPAGFTSTRDRLASEIEDDVCAMYDLPMLLAKERCGFHFEEYPEDYASVRLLPDSPLADISRDGRPHRPEPAAAGWPLGKIIGWSIIALFALMSVGQAFF